MPAETCKVLQGSRKTQRKKEKRRKKTSSTTLARDTAKPRSVSSPPENRSSRPVGFPAQPQGQRSKKDIDSPAGRSKKHSKDPAALLTLIDKTGGGKTRGCVAESNIQARESVRWVGVLEDPQAEEKRLEIYRANRRRRYREALFKETPL